CSK
ncbi:hypothetical protein D046_4352B, partial [Vibrio parahaemolyticus V-223/04]